MVLQTLQTRSSNGGGSNVFTALFGETPKVGDKVTLRQAFEKTFKSAAEIKRLAKNWAEKGIVVEFKQEKNLLESTYTITKLA